MEKKGTDKNHIRIRFNSRVGNIIRYVNALLIEDKPKTLYFSAIGGAIGLLVNAIEVIKIVNPGFYQINQISSVAHKTVDNSSKTETIERLSPKMDITLTLEKPTNTNDEGYQDKLSEEERIKLFDKLNEKTQRKGGNGNFRGTTRGDRGGRGGRGGRGFNERRGGNERKGEGKPREEGNFNSGKNRNEYREKDDHTEIREERGQYRGGNRGYNSNNQGYGYGNQNKNSNNGDRRPQRGNYGEQRPQRGGNYGEQRPQRGNFNSGNGSRPMTMRGRGSDRGGYSDNRRGSMNNSRY